MSDGWANHLFWSIFLMFILSFWMSKLMLMILSCPNSLQLRRWSLRRQQALRRLASRNPHSLALFTSLLTIFVNLITFSIEHILNLIGLLTNSLYPILTALNQPIQLILFINFCDEAFLQLLQLWMALNELFLLALICAFQHFYYHLFAYNLWLQLLSVSEFVL